MKSLRKLRYTLVFNNLFLLSFNKVFYFCDGRAGFSAVITPVFSVTRSFRNHSNMLIWCSNVGGFIIIINFENICAATFFFFPLDKV